MPAFLIDKADSPPRPLRRLLVTVCAVSVLLSPLSVIANEALTSPSYRLDPNVSNSFGGFSESGSYRLLDSGGEAAIGLGESGSYRLASGYIEQLTQSIELNVLPDGLVAYYPLNTGAGERAYDVSPYDHHGTFEGAPAWTQGKVGSGALEFDGVNDYINAGDSQHISNTPELTWQAWVYPTNVSKDQMFISKQSADYFRILQGRPFLSLRINNSQQTFHSSTELSNGNWYLLTATYDGQHMRIYVNGQPAGERSVSGTLSLNSGNLHLGQWTLSSPRRFVGKLDEVKIYNRALDEDEILDSYIANQRGVASVLTLPRIGASASRTVNAVAVVATDAPGYDLGISQDGNLRTSKGEEIPSAPGSVEFPAPWSEGVTEGLGFTILGAVQRDGKWGTGPNYEYAAIPGSARTFHSRSGLTGGEKEVTTLQFRLAVSGAQTAGVYSNRLGFTATMKP